MFSEAIHQQAQGEDGSVRGRRSRALGWAAGEEGRDSTEGGVRRLAYGSGSRTTHGGSEQPQLLRPGLNKEQDREQGADGQQKKIRFRLDTRPLPPAPRDL